jgi:hypothetical protein
MIFSAAVAADPKTPEAKREGAMSLIDADRLSIRESQLSVAQAHISFLQAQAQVREAEAGLVRLVETLKTQYACQPCELNADFTWKRTLPAKPEENATKETPAPPKGGQTSNKE